MSLSTDDITCIIRASRETLGLDQFGRKKCKYLGENDTCMKGASSSGRCMQACSYYDARGASFIKDNCEHHFPIPNIGMCCGYYSKTVDAYGMGYAHYPNCKKENCPFAHPELVAGRKLESEIEARCKMVGGIPIAERDNKRCYFCGAKLSVKYLVEVDMPAKAPAPFRVYACNMCALIKIR